MVWRRLATATGKDGLAYLVDVVVGLDGLAYQLVVGLTTHDGDRRCLGVLA